MAIEDKKLGDSEKNLAIEDEKLGDSRENIINNKIEWSIILERCTEKHYKKATISKIETIYRRYKAGQVFGPSDVREVLSCPYSTARLTVNKIREIDAVVQVKGSGKGMYRFKYATE